MQAESAAVLIVDDAWLVRAATEVLVKAAGFTPVLARNADEAIGILEARSDIELVITDIDMPGTMDGVALLHIIQRRWPSIHLMVISALDNLSERGIPEGTSVFSKPLPYSELTTRLQDLLIKPVWD